MAYNVLESIMVHWQPAESPPDDAPAETLADYTRWLKRRGNRDIAHKAMIVLANFAQVVDTDWSMTWVKVEAIAAHIQKTPRQTQRILRRLESAGDIVTVPCDGQCAARGTRPNHNHYWLPRPLRAPAWVIAETKPTTAKGSVSHASHKDAAPGRES